MHLTTQAVCQSETEVITRQTKVVDTQVVHSWIELTSENWLVKDKVLSENQQIVTSGKTRGEIPEGI